MPIDYYTIRPNSGAFDVAKIEEHLGLLEFVIRDPVRTDLLRYLICEDAHLADFIHRKRIESPKKRWSIGIVDIWSDRVEVAQVCDADHLRLVRDFVRWLTTAFRCSIVDGWGGEHTNIDTLFPEDLDTT